MFNLLLEFTILIPNPPQIISHLSIPTLLIFVFRTQLIPLIQYLLVVLLTACQLSTQLGYSLHHIQNI